MFSDYDTTRLAVARDKVEALCKAECIETFGIVATCDNETRDAGADINVYVLDPDHVRFRLPKTMDGFAVSVHAGGAIA